jgi:hypothetical protein
MRIQRVIISTIVILALCGVGTTVIASTGTIDPEHAYVWGENLGWINLAPTKGGLQISDTAITGYAWSSRVGWILFSPTGSDVGVTNTSSGVLGGHAWSANVGWIPMEGATIGSDGRFHGIVGNPGSSAGRINFSCDECDARTDWRPATNHTIAPSVAGGGGGILVPMPVPITSSVPETPTLTDTRKQQNIKSDELATTTSSFVSRLKQLSMDVSNNSQMLKKSDPIRLFDIKLELDSVLLENASDLIARVRFESFGTVATYVDLHYRILNAEGGEVYASNATTSVETERVVTKTFDDLSLPAGEYVLILSTTYNENVKDEFRQSFRVLLRTSSRRVYTSGVFMVSSLLLGGILLTRYYQRKQKSNGL